MPKKCDDNNSVCGIKPFCTESEHLKIMENARNKQHTADEVSRMATFFSVLSDPSRLLILNLLESGALCVGHIAETLNMTQSAVSHHLALMKNLNLVKLTKNGKQNIYSLSDIHIKSVLDVAYEHILER